MENIKIKVKELIFDSQDFLFKECLRLYKSGPVDPDEFETSYRLPMIILSVASKNLAKQYSFGRDENYTGLLKHF